MCHCAMQTVMPLTLCFTHKCIKYMPFIVNAQRLSPAFFLFSMLFYLGCEYMLTVREHV